jgi:hypothetical protein
VITFAVGLKGANFTLLDKIVQKGGSPDCDTTSARYACDVSGGADKLSIALAKICQSTVKTVTHPVTYTLSMPITRTITHTEYRTEIQTTPVPCEWGIASCIDLLLGCATIVPH